MRRRCDAGHRANSEGVILRREALAFLGGRCMKRREVLQLLAGAMMTVSRDAAAQTSTKTYRLASLTAGGPGAVASPTSNKLFSPPSTRRNQIQHCRGYNTF